VISIDRARGGFLDEVGRSEVRESLAEIDGAMLGGQPGDLGKNRSPKSVEPMSGS
jgi:hypothetical protein